ncbi:YybH family protein [Saccharomonospora iraqiensis]|uniref:YybH family protein n=1 Tax=Saccharomonospora iraqiensis TaxID=52698 RepID=UPI00022E1903|nr:nuclear transport factor 2 family protein [Saccharomonospora iraqiensis]
MPTSATDRERISAVIDRYRRGFATMGVDDLLAIWDRDYDHLVHVALEEATPRRTWKDIEAYYHRVPSSDPAFQAAMHVDTLSIGVLGDVAHAFCHFRFEGRHGGHAPPFVVEGRSTFLMRRHDASWKVIHYRESAPPETVDQPTTDSTPLGSPPHPG